MSSTGDDEEMIEIDDDELDNDEISAQVAEQMALIQNDEDGDDSSNFYQQAQAMIDGEEEDVDEEEIEDENIVPSTYRDELPSVREEKEVADDLMVQNTLSIEWVFGVNKDIINGVHNLTSSSRKEIFYVAGHIGVIYRYATREQILLQGHTNPITCVAVSQDKRWIVTADSGVENMIVVWDSTKGIPIKTIFTPHQSGTKSIDISDDALYIVTLSLASEGESQTLSIWEWTSDRTTPIHSQKIAEADTQILVRFHPEDGKLLVTNGTKRVIFWGWRENELVSHAPPISSKDFRQPVGDFTYSTFIPGTTLAATGTVDGEMVFWQDNPAETNTDIASELRKIALKVVKLHTNAAINIITTVNQYIVTGGDDGYVKFFDHKLRLEAWFEEFNEGPIVSISFDRIEKLDEAELYAKKEGKDKKSSEAFESPDFIVGTSAAAVLRVHSAAYIEYDAEKLKGESIVQGQEAAIQCLAPHPRKHLIAISGLSGHIHLWDYVNKKVQQICKVNNLFISCIAYDPKGEFLAVACTNGTVKVLDGVKLEEKLSFRPSRACILDLKFSHDSLYFAFTDSDNCVGIFRWGHRDDDDRKPIEWVYVGRYRSHKKPITGLEFGVVPYGDVAQLMSVGEDKLLIEYNLLESSVTEGVKIKSVHRISQTAIPTAFLWTRHENLIEHYKNEPSEPDYLIFANNQYKLTAFITPYAKRDTRCIRTILSPTYGGPLNRMVIVPDPSGTPKYMVYSTHEKVVGIIQLPLDGNPNCAMGLIAHSGEISDICVSFDGRYLFTAGSNDFTVNQWSINGSYLQSDRMPREEAYVNLIEGGADGEFFQEIKQYFYYAQVRSQGEMTTNERKITGQVPLSQVPDLIRALSFYATEWEIHNMVSELRLMMGYQSLGLGQENTKAAKILEPNEIYVDFDSFIKVYVNHRPVTGTQRKDIQEAFNILGADTFTGIMQNAHFFKLLMSQGEKMDDFEIDKSLSILRGEETSHRTFDTQFTAVDFAENLLGFEDYEEGNEANVEQIEQQETVQQDEEQNNDDELSDTSF